jgi:hypothetical protein
MASVHLVVGVAVMALSFTAAILGSIGWATDRSSAWFWYVLRAAQAALVVGVLLGMLLLATGREAIGEHYMYGAIALLASFFGEGMRAGVASSLIPARVDFESLPRTEQRSLALRIVRRETAVMTLAVWLVAICAFRAAQTSGHLF